MALYFCAAPEKVRAFGRGFAMRINTRIITRIGAVALLGLTVSACTDMSSLLPSHLVSKVTNYSILSGASVMATDKTIPDHIVSYRSGKDCSTVRTEQGRTYCREDEPNPQPVAYCYRTLGDVTCYAEPDPARHPGEQIGNL